MKKPISEYWASSTHPLVSLIFVAPILVLYEAGVIVLGPQAMRNGADVWLRQFLDLLGFGQYFMLPLMTVFLLLAWHHTTRLRWRFSTRLLYGMCAESALLGAALVAFAYFQLSVYHTLSTHGEAPAAAALVASAETGQIVGYFGAGIYEELLFRLMLLPIVVGAVRGVGGSPRTSMIAAVVLTSLFFSAAHYQIFSPAGDSFAWFTFMFRFLAGVIFSVLFLYRGFGIAVGTHTLYDIFIAYW